MSAYAVFEVNPNPDATVEQLRNYDEYKSQDVKLAQYYKVREKVIYIAIVTGIIGIIYYLYDK